MSIIKDVVETTDDVIEAPDIATMPTEEAVRYLVETFGTNEHDALEMILVAKGELTNEGSTANE